MLDHDRIIAAEAEALAVAAEATDPSTPVPATDWTMSDLLDHVGRLTWFFAGRVRNANGGEFYETTCPPDVSPPDFVRQGATTLREQLAAADPEVDVKTWAGMKPPSWVSRRMAHELAVHRRDAQAAAGDPAPLDTDVADDGIDELLQEFLPLADLSEVGGTIHLHATDGDGEWFIQTAGGVSWSRAHEKGDVAVRGTTSDLLLHLWGRVSQDAVEVLGDATVLERWRAATRF